MKTSLRIGRVKQYQSYHSTQMKFRRFKNKYWPMEIKDAINGGVDFSIPDEMNRFVISSQCSGFWYWKKYIPILDCDSGTAKDEAVLSLLREGYHYWIFKSSQNPDKYWVIVDVSGSLDWCLSFMGSIPGCDRNYINMCRRDQAIVLRAFPKNGFRPSYLSNIHDLQPLNKKPTTRWLYDFWKWWVMGNNIVEFLLSQQQAQIVMGPFVPNPSIMPVPSSTIMPSEFSGMIIMPSGYVGGHAGYSGFTGYVGGHAGYSGFTGISGPIFSTSESGGGGGEVAGEIITGEEFLDKLMKKKEEKPKSKFRQIRIEDE